MHAQMKHTLANLQDLIPTLAGLWCLSLCKPKKGLNLVHLLESDLCMHGYTNLAGIVFV